MSGFLKDFKKSQGLSPIVAYLPLALLVFLGTPHWLHSRPGASPEAYPASALTIPARARLSGGILTGGIYAPQPPDHLVAQSGMHLRIQGWLGVRDSGFPIRNLVLKVDGTPWSENHVYTVLSRSPQQSIAGWSVLAPWPKVEIGQHRLTAVVTQTDGTEIQIDSRDITVVR